jgi:hypothetical protein
MDQDKFYDFIMDKEDLIVKCYICHSPLQDLYICDRCEEYYCENCSYSYTLNYQFQGSRCYACAGQDRRYKLSIEEIDRNGALIIQIFRNKQLEKLMNENTL